MINITTKRKQDEPCRTYFHELSNLDQGMMRGRDADGKSMRFGRDY